MSLSVVIPARNESGRLPRTLRRLHAYLKRTHRDAEIIVVDHASDDATAEAAQNAASPEFPMTVLRSDGGGVGRAVRLGMLRAGGERVLFCDADGPVPFSFVRCLDCKLDEGADIAAGVREVTIPQPMHRIVMGGTWRKLVEKILDVPIRDTQCGFKMFTRAAARRVFEPARIESFVFHVESLARAHRAGLSVQPVPVRWADQPGSKIHIVGDTARMSRDLVRLAWHLQSERLRARMVNWAT